MKRLLSILIVLLFTTTVIGQKKIVLRGGSGGATIDTTNKWLTRVYRKTGSDSVFYIKGGVATFAFKDSTGGGTPTLQQVTDAGDTTTRSIRFGKLRSITGTMLTDNFIGGGFGSTNYDTSFASLTRTFNGSYLQVTGGNGTFTNNVNYNKYTGRNQWSQSIKFVPTDLSASTYGVGLGQKSFNSFYPSGFFVHYICDNTSEKGKMRFWSNSGTQIGSVGTESIAFSIGDTLLATCSYLDGVVTATFRNVSTSTTASFVYDFGTAVAGTYQAPNTGKFTVQFFGGTQKIFNYTISSNETKNNVIFLGNSITYGYTATTLAQRYVSQIFPARYSYETSGGPGDRSAEGVLVIPEIKLLKPKYLIYALGVNDAINGVTTATYSANVRQTFDSLIANGITPIIISASPNNTNNVTPYNDTLQAIATRYSLKYINLFDSLKGTGTSWKPSYTTDNIHPNDSGHLVMARMITRLAPEIMGDTIIYANRPAFNSDIRYFYGLNEKTGRMELNTAGSVVSGALNYYPVFTGSSTLGSGQIYKGTNSTGINTTNPYNYGSTFHNFQVEGNSSGFSTITQSVAGSNLRVYGGVDGSGTYYFGYNNNGTLSNRGAHYANGNFSWGVATDASTSLFQLTATGQPQLGIHYSPSVYTTMSTNSSGFYQIVPTGNQTEITGNLRFSGALMPNNTAGTSGQVLTSAGAGLVPTWTQITNGIVGTAVSLTASSTSTIVVTATGQTITLPTAVGISGRIYVIKLTAAGTATVATTSSQTIDAATTYSLSAQYKYVQVQSDNANWVVIANN